MEKLYCCSRNYRSPELLLGLDFDYKTDVFSLGIVTLESLLEFNPLQASSSRELLESYDNLFSKT